MAWGERTGRCLCLFAGVLLVAEFMLGCVTLNRATKFNYDRRPISIETFSLFNQRLGETGSGPKWQGDWYLRRLRLALIDQNLRSSKPDLMIFQEAMARESHPADSDEDILAMGALRGYLWDRQAVQKYDDTGETESLLMAVGPPLLLDESVHLSSESRVVDLGDGSKASWVRVTLNKRPLLVFNVNLSEGVSMRPEVYERLYQAIITASNQEPWICLERVVLAGRFSGTLFDLDFIRRLQFKDVSAGFCNVASSCYTATMDNELFALANPGYLPLQLDRIFVHESALVTASRRTEDNAEPAPPVVQSYGLSRLYPAKRFGWAASVRFNGCD